MTEPSTLIVRKNPSDAEKLARITALGALILSDPKNRSFHARLARAYVDAEQFDEAIETNKICYNLNIKDGDKIHAAKAAGEMGHCFFKRSRIARNRDSEEAQDWEKWQESQEWRDWLNGMKWKLQACKLYRKLRKTNPDDQENIKNYALNAGEIGQEYSNASQRLRKVNPEKADECWLNGMTWKKQQHKLISTLINSDPNKKHDLAMIAGKIGQEYLDASQRLRQANSKQADEYWVNGIKWKKKSWHFDEKLSWTDKSTIEHTIENCAKTAGHIGQEYLKASKRLQQASPKQAEKYWQEGMAWKEKAYGSYKELSHTDSSKEQDCAKTAAQLGKEFADQENFEEAIEWYEIALEHNPDNEFIIKRLEALEEALKILAAHQEVKMQRS